MNLFKSQTFTGEPAPEDLITGLKNETLWIISVLPRMVRFPAEDIEKEAQPQKLFKTAA